MEGGEGSSDQSPDFWWKDLRARPSPDFTLCSPEIAKKGGYRNFWTNPDFFRGKYNEPFP